MVEMAQKGHIMCEDAFHSPPFLGSQFLYYKENQSTYGFIHSKKRNRLISHTALQIRIVRLQIINRLSLYGGMLIPKTPPRLMTRHKRDQLGFHRMRQTPIVATTQRRILILMQCWAMHISGSSLLSFFIFHIVNESGTCSLWAFCCNLHIIF